MDEDAFDAIVLAGGSARRLHGADKPGLDVGGRSLLDRVLDAVAAAGHTVVVGPRRASARDVTWCREEPPGGGPVAAIAAALPYVAAETVLVLAADLPWIAPGVPALLAARRSADVAVLVDAQGRRNQLAAAWRRAALLAAVERAGDPSGVSARSLFRGADIMDVTDCAGWGSDCDTWDELAEARRRSARESSEQGSGT